MIIDEVFGHPTRDLSRVHFDKVYMVGIVHSSRINAVYSICLLSIKNKCLKEAFKSICFIVWFLIDNVFIKPLFIPCSALVVVNMSSSYEKLKLENGFNVVSISFENIVLFDQVLRFTIYEQKLSFYRRDKDSRKL